MVGERGHATECPNSCTFEEEGKKGLTKKHLECEKCSSGALIRFLQCRSDERYGTRHIGQHTENGIDGGGNLHVPELEVWHISAAPGPGPGPGWLRHPCRLGARQYLEVVERGGAWCVVRGGSRGDEMLTLNSSATPPASTKCCTAKAS